MIEFNQVEFSHRHRRIFTRLSLNLERGKFVVISGPARSGKTTLVKLITGLYSPDAGDIFVEGEHLAELRNSNRKLREWRRKIGGIGGIYSLLSDRTILENVSLAAEISGLSPHLARRYAVEACSKYRLSHVTSHFPGAVSEVERRAALLARTEAARKDLIIADGPTDGLDAKSARFINERLTALRMSGVTIVYLTSGDGPENGPDANLKIKDGNIAA